eukprot:m.239677 g.239677  ORF g.239677 m.239677 type:complete len:51 (+) comp16070_c1_seq2:106-258(+)
MGTKGVLGAEVIPNQIREKQKERATIKEWEGKVHLATYQKELELPHAFNV